ncbi:hypothetical protein O9992_26075 [Vibrio lentus]|nr:hypothetical protein [Vibrio lentus]
MLLLFRGGSRINSGINVPIGEGISMEYVCNPGRTRVLEIWWYWVEY